MQVTNLNVSFGNLHLLKNISFILNRDDRVCLLGRNGCGKSTLLKALTQQIPEASGNIDLQHQTITMLRQEIELTDYHLTIYDYLRREVPENYSFDYELERLSHRLDFTPGLETPLGQLSGGEKTKVLLMALLLSDADILLLDEPTNNLDLDTIVFLENYLAHCQRKMILVSHDEEFLAKVTNKIFELDKGQITEYNMGYETYLYEKDLKYARDLEEYEDAVAKRDRLRNRLQQHRDWAERGYRTKPQDKDKILYKANREAIAKTEHKGTVIRRELEKMTIPDFEKREKITFNIAYMDGKGNRNLILEELVCGYENFQVGPFNLTLPFGKRLSVVGKNGSGKTTLIRTILNQIAPLSGKVRVGSGLHIGYLSQSTLQDDSEATVFEYITAGQEHVNKGEIFALLKRFYISYDMKDRHYNSLSPGERAKINLAKLALAQVNLLILDEVTNHLDVEAVHVIEDVVSSFQGAIINISHNRHFSQLLKPDFVLDVASGNVKIL